MVSYDENKGKKVVGKEFEGKKQIYSSLYVSEVTSNFVIDKDGFVLFDTSYLHPFESFWLPTSGLVIYAKEDILYGKTRFYVSLSITKHRKRIKYKIIIL